MNMRSNRFFDGKSFDSIYIFQKVEKNNEKSVDTCIGIENNMPPCKGNLVRGPRVRPARLKGPRSPSGGLKKKGGASEVP